MLKPESLVEKAAWADGWQAASAGIERHECLYYPTLAEQQAFGLGWDKRTEGLDMGEPGAAPPPIPD